MIVVPSGIGSGTRLDGEAQSSMREFMFRRHGLGCCFHRVREDESADLEALPREHTVADVAMLEGNVRTIYAAILARIPYYQAIACHLRFATPFRESYILKMKHSCLGLIAEIIPLKS